MKLKITKARPRARIGEEIGKVPKAAGRPAKISPTVGKNKNGREATGIGHTARSRYQKLAAAKPVAKAPAVAPMLIVLRAIAMLLVTDRHAGVRLTNAQRFHIGGTS
jgi:hypothetical protein